MINRAEDPRTEDTIVYELLRTERGAGGDEVVGHATFRGGRFTVDAPDEVRLAVEEQLARAFVDRVQADERPRGYRRSGRGVVDMLVPGMPEHFIARMRGLWLSYPDGSVVTAREATAPPPARPRPRTGVPDTRDAGAPVTDPSVRRATLATTDDVVGARPLVRPNAPVTGLRPDDEPQAPVRRTDCGWIV